MKLIPCPLNGARPEDEFVCGGRVRGIPSHEAEDSAWRDYLYFNSQPTGEVWEWWCHIPSGHWFAALRDPISDKFIQTLTVAEMESFL